MNSNGNSGSASAVGDGDCVGLELLSSVEKCMDSPFPVIKVRDGFKKYGSGKGATVVLQNYQMNVEKATIYALLGASGCGKTTLLSCVVGLKLLDKGEILINGAAPGTSESGVPGRRVGYMPQEVALYELFTIKEAMMYFGRIYGMSTPEIVTKIDFLVHLLNLPPNNRLIRTLSGGQKRRVSFGISLAHDPEILICDEPTCQLDPILRRSIWNYLTKLVAERRTTILITTHYIEEARQANRVGIMRSGKLLAEDSPLNLMKMYNCTLLEDIVLKFSEMDELEIENERKSGENQLQQVSTTNNDSHSDKNVAKNRRSSSKSKFISQRPPSEKPSYPHTRGSIFGRFRALTIKNFIMLFRNIWFVLFVFILPATQVAVVCTAIGLDPQNINMGIVNKEVKNASDCKAPKGCTLSNLSCRYLKVLPVDSVVLIPYESEEEATEATIQGNTWGFISFPKDFSAHMYERALSGSLADNDTVYGARFKVQLDMSNKQIGHTMKRIFIEAFRTFSTKLMIDCDIEPTGRDLPLYFGDPIFGTDDTSFREFLAPSVAIGCVYFFTLCSCGLVYIVEKREGMLDRTLVAGVGTLESMVSHLFTQFFVLLGQVLLVFIVLIPIFNIVVKGSLIWVMVLLVLVGCCGMSLGFLVSTICNEEKHAIQLAMACFFPNFLLAGMLWPVEAMPTYLRYFSYTLPSTLAGESIRSMFTRGWGISHNHVWPGFVVTIGWIVVHWLLIVFVHTCSRRRG